MSKTKNILKDKLLDLKSYMKDGKKQAFFAFFLILSLGFIFIVYAENTQNFVVEISDLKITSSDNTDLTNSTSPSIKSYDSIKYAMNYIMKQENTDLPSVGISSKDLIVEVKVPKDSSTVMINNNVIESSSVDGNNNVYKATISDIQLLSTYSNLTIIIEKIKPIQTNIQPIITIKESGSTSITTISNKTFSITSTESKNYNLYVGGAIKSDDSITVPVGVIAYMDNNLLGKKAASSLNYKLSVKVNDVEQTLSNPLTYNTNSEYKVNNMPYTLFTDEESGVTYTLNQNDISVSNIKMNYENIFDEDNKYLLLSSVIPVTFSKSNSDISIKISLNDGEKSIEYTLYKNAVIGDLNSNIEISKDNVVQNVFNIDEEFNIKTSLNYSNNNSYSADKLSNLTTYLKVDNNAIKIINDEDNIPIKITDEKGNTITPKKITYGVGALNSTNFKIKTGAPSGCPTSINSGDDIIKLYGGPCIEETSSYEWKDTLLKDSENVYDVSIVKIELENIDPNTVLDVSLKAKIKNSSDDSININNIINREFNVYNSSITTINSNTYYLNTNNIITDDETSVANATTSMISGPFTNNKVKVSILRTTVSLKSYDMNDNQRDSFTLGLNDPIKWKINVKTLLSSVYNTPDAKVNLQLTIEVPSNLNVQNIKDYLDLGEPELLSNGSKKYDVSVSSKNKDETLEFVTGVSELIQSEEVATVKIIVNSNISINEDVVSSGNDEISRTSIHNVNLYNDNKISLLGQTDKHYFNENTPYAYNMKVYNNSLPAGKLNLVSALPYSSYSGSYSVSIDNLVSGYTVYYTQINNPENIYTNEINNKSLNNWQVWTNPSEAKTGITGLKIESNSSIGVKQYFSNVDGINVTITPSDNKRGDKYINNFLVIDSSNNAYPSKNSEVSVYDRKISGFVFNDSNYNGQYDEEESNVVDLEIELYKSNVTGDYDINQTPLYINENDEKIDSVTTDTDGTYSFSGLEEGVYYTKVKFDTEKYTVTSYQIENNSVENISAINSKYLMVPNTDYVVSKLLVLNDNNMKSSNINLGFRTKQIFNIALNKYITNVKVIKGNSEQNYNYEKAKQVKLDVKNLKNTTVEVTYGFELYNTKYFPGYVGDIVESIPYGMKFDSNKKENSLWEGNNEYLHYKGLDNILIMPDKKYYFKITLSLDGESAGNYINVVSAGNLKMMELLQ